MASRRRRDTIDAAPLRRRRRATHTIRHRRGAPETPSTRTQVWYKDEGGREKCILLNVSLEDGSGSKIKDRPVQLKCLLRYAESGMPVTNQNVLRIWTDSHDKKPSIKLYKGSLAIKARVEDVSKNHQGQSFMYRDNGTGAPVFVPV